MDMAMRVYQNIGRNILRMTAVSTVFCLAAFAFVFFYALPSFGTTENQSSINVQVSEALFTMFLAGVVGVPLLMMGISQSTIVIVQLASDYMLGNVPNERSIKETARRLWPKMLGTVLVETLFVFGGLIIGALLLVLSAIVASQTAESNASAGVVSLLATLAIIFGFIALPFVAARHALVFPIAIIEGISPFKAAKRSAQLLRGDLHVHSGYHTIFALYLTMGFLLLILFLGYGTIMSVIPSAEATLKSIGGTAFGAIVTDAIGLVPLYLALWTLIPVWCTTTTILYYERRIRWEGYDIEALAQDVWRADRRSRFEL